MLLTAEWCSLCSIITLFYVEDISIIPGIIFSTLAGTSELIKKRYIAAGIAALVILVFCHDSDPQVVQVQPQQDAMPPQVVYQQPAPVVVHDSDNGGFFNGLMMGHLMSGGHGYSNHHTTVVNKTVVVNRSAPRRYYGRGSYASRSGWRPIRSIGGRRR